jgi:Flp pilus assembly protein TadG
MTSLARRQDGQVAVITAIFLVALLGCAGIVLDVGSWFRQQRVTQATVDAAALAGAQALPGDPSSATSLATDFANKNSGVAGASVSVTSTWVPNDTIKVTQSKPAAGFFSSLFGFNTVTVHAHATAVSEVPTAVMGAAPIAVWIGQQELSGPGCPCFGVPTQLPLGKKGAPGAFGLIDLDSSKNGTDGASVVAQWISQGFNQYLPLGGYYSRPGAAFSNSSIQAALDGKYGSDLLFPVYDTLTDDGSNATYHVIAWAAFHLTNSVASGNDGTLSGWFDSVIWDGIVSQSGPPQNVPDLGVHSVALID